MRKQKTVIFYFLLITAMIDIINGLCLSIFSDSNFSFGQVFRLFFCLMLILSIILYKDKSNRKMFLFIIIAYYLINTLIGGYLDSSSKVIFSDLINVFKLFLPMLIIVACYELNQVGKFSIDYCNKIIEFNTVIVTTSLIIFKIFNIGYHSYNDEIGFRGLYNSTNELSIVISVMYVFVLDKIYNVRIIQKKWSYKSILLLFISIVALLLTGSKTGIGVIIVISIIYLIKMIANKKNKHKIMQTIVLLIIIFIILFIIYNVYNAEILSIIAREQYFYNSRDLFSFILSDRNSLLSEVWGNQVSGKANLIRILFGFRNFSAVDTTFVNIELDGFVLFINYGVIGFIMIILFYLSLFAKSWKIKDKKIYPYKLAYIMITLFSLLAGHVMFGAFAGTFLAIVAVPLLIYE